MAQKILVAALGGREYGILSATMSSCPDTGRAYWNDVTVFLENEAAARHLQRQLETGLIVFEGPITLISKQPARDAVQVRRVSEMGAGQPTSPHVKQVSNAIQAFLLQENSVLLPGYTKDDRQIVWAENSDEMCTKLDDLPPIELDTDCSADKDIRRAIVGLKPPPTFKLIVEALESLGRDCLITIESDEAEENYIIRSTLSSSAAGQSGDRLNPNPLSMEGRGGGARSENYGHQETNDEGMVDMEPSSAGHCDSSHCDSTSSATDMLVEHPEAFQAAHDVKLRSTFTSKSYNASPPLDLHEQPRAALTHTPARQKAVRGRGSAPPT
jgi:hypothetical protein